MIKKIHMLGKKMDIPHYISTFSDPELNIQLVTAAKSEDEIGAILRLHLYLEHVIEILTASLANNPKMFDGKTNFSFNQKLQLSINFGLPSDIALAIKKINSIRNKTAHRLNSECLDDADISYIEEILKDSKYMIGDSHMSLKKTTYILEGIKKPYNNLNNKEKLCLICMFILCLIARFARSVSEDSKN